MNPQPDSQHFTITPKPQPLPLVADYVPAEAFIETIGFFSPSSKRIRHRFTKEKILGEKLTADGTTKTVKVKVSANHELGLPVTIDGDYFRALLKVIDETADTTGRLPQPLRVPTTKLIRYAGKTENARRIREVADFFDVLIATLITGGLYRKKFDHYDEGFSGTILTQVIRRGQPLKTGQPADTNYIWLSPWFLSNYFYGHRRPIDIAFYNRLRKPIAKALAPLLETGWYATRGKPYTKRYTDLCAEFLLAEYRQLSRIHEQLDPAHKELQCEQLLAPGPVDVRSTADGCGFTITWKPGPKWFADQQARQDRRALSDRIATRPVIPTEQRDNGEAEAQAAIVGLLVNDLIEYTGDRHSEANWRQLARECVRDRRHHLVHQAISETKAADVPPGTVENKGAHVNSRLRALMAQFDLFPRAPDPSAEEFTPPAAPK
jgi:hypothetical protein